MEEIDQDIECGLLTTWEQVQDLIVPFPRGDSIIEGQELEPALQPDEQHWVDEESDNEDDDDLDPGGGGAGDGGGGESTTVVDSGVDAVPSGVYIGSISLEEANANYVSMLEIASRPGSGVDRGTLMYLQMKCASSKKVLHSMQDSPGEIAAYTQMQVQAQAAQQALKQMQKDIAQEDILKKAEKTASKNSKDKKKEHKHKKDDHDKKDAKHKKDAKEKKDHKHKKYDKEDKNKKDKHKTYDTDDKEDKSKHAPAHDAKSMGGSRLQVLSHLLPEASTLEGFLATERARKAQKVGAADDVPSQGAVVGASVFNQAPGQASSSSSSIGVSVSNQSPGQASSSSSSIGVSVPNQSSGSSSSVKLNKVCPMTLCLYEQAEKQAAKELHKEWTLDMFGHGHLQGGTLLHKRNRYETFIRLIKRSEALGHPLSAAVLVRFPAFLVYEEGKRLRSPAHKATMGAAHFTMLKYLRDGMAKDSAFFKRWAIEGVAKMPKAAVLL
jgi:hypothetical protein